VSLVIELVPVFDDNYSYLIYREGQKSAVVVDPGEAGPVMAKLQELGLALEQILITHHHGDHVQGVAELVQATSCAVVGPKYEESKISGLTMTVAEGDELIVLGESVETFLVPGHTQGHIAFYIPGANALFSGDSLFVLGCGRLFEGSPADMWGGLQKLRKLPGETLVYCGHEYTLANAGFCATIEKGNEALNGRISEIKDLRSEGRPTIPSTISTEQATNPFLRADLVSVAESLGMSGASALEVFTEVRHRKDNF
jgi:hydroxyacylglutathione hydrolase